MFTKLNALFSSALTLTARIGSTAFAAGTTRRVDTHTLRDVGMTLVAIEFAD